jgi:DNA-binding HxlR family transcriptional regulator
MRKTESEHVHCVLDPGCASRRLFEAVSGKWSPLVVMTLKDGGKKRHGELRRELGGVSQKMLIQTLRQLETNGLVEREVYPVVPPKVEYSLTPLGLSLQPLVGGGGGTPAHGRGSFRLRGVAADSQRCSSHASHTV